ncbi:hypothetical protein JZ751_019196 [Albula glossodonta]|uniref:Galectin n=1 Tax=Albula glossodonta TaxID=121402 RepID=A0A8T2NMA9_9TELE|nr:hypothetical protein JZ751_019196 [Albula glossodonta]
MWSHSLCLLQRVPFTGCIQGGLQEGKTITVTGRVMPAAERFHVNLQCGSQGRVDIALHFNPRYDRRTGHVVCNTFTNTKWCTEERKNQAPIPRGSSFTLMFLVKRDSFAVIVNGNHFMEYLHRLPIQSVNTISVDGGVEVNSITFQNPVQHVVPYKNIITGGLSPGRHITIQGAVNHNANRFSLNLRFNNGIALHFNPRFDENLVVRNSFLKEMWGQEERSGGIPFCRGQPFTLTIVCETQFFKMIVNGGQMFTYNHRHFIFQEIDILEINGDVSLSSVAV